MTTPSTLTRGTNAGRQQQPLYLLCYEHLPSHRKTSKNLNGTDWNGLDLDKLSKELKVSKQKINDWFKNNKLPAQRLMPLEELPGSTLTYELLRPFLSRR